jgi:hypothetical protein
VTTTLYTETEKSGLDVLNLYSIYEGPACTSDSFIYPWVDSKASYTTATLDVQSGFDVLKSIIGLIQIQFNVIKTVNSRNRGLFNISIEAVINYSFQGQNIQKKSLLVPRAKLFSPITLPIPSVHENSNLGVSEIPIYIVANLSPEQVYTTMYNQSVNSTSRSTTVSPYTTFSTPFSVMFFANRYDIDLFWNQSSLKPLLSDISSSLATPFQINSSIFSAITSGSELLVKIFDAVVIGGLSVNISYSPTNVVSRPNPGTIIGLSNLVTLASSLIQLQTTSSTAK